jgi:hypothetical protein
MYYIKRLFFKFTKYVYYKLTIFKSFKDSRLGDYFNLLWILKLGSNHPDRFDLLYNKKKNKVNFYNVNWKINREIKNVYLVIGDSHSELYGTNFKSNYRKDSIFITVWLGPVLLIKFLKSNILIKRSIFFINQIIKFFGYNKKYYIILSFGEIDIRTYFFRKTILNKSSNAIDELLKKYHSLLNKKIDEIIKNIKKKDDIAFFFKEPPPTTINHGVEPGNRDDMTKVYEKEEYPVFGNVKTRVAWHKKFKEKVLINSHVIKNLENSRECYDNTGGIRKDISDGIHINSEKIIVDFQNNLLDQTKT